MQIFLICKLFAIFFCKPDQPCLNRFVNQRITMARITNPRQRVDSATLRLAGGVKKMEHCLEYRKEGIIFAPKNTAMVKTENHIEAGKGCRKMNVSPISVYRSNPQTFTSNEVGMNRRTFLKKLGWGAGAAVVAPSVLTQKVLAGTKEVKPFVVAEEVITIGENNNTLPIKFSLLRLNGANDGFYDAAKMEYTQINNLRDTKKFIEKDLTALGRDDKGLRFYMFGQSGDNPSIYREFEPLMNFFKKAKSKLSLNPNIRFIK